MGIPYFFSYIIKAHKNIIKNICFLNEKQIDNFFLDSNSIIYDVVYNIKEYKGFDIEDYIINKVIEKIEFYIDLIKPKNIVYIAFDGIPPLSKMEQQRSRRYKSWYSNEIKKIIKKNYNENNEEEECNIFFDTINITCGTLFMNKLSSKIKNYFIKNNDKVIFSGSDEYGEGESKIFEYIRKNFETTILLNSSNIIFGLDSDIIILSLNNIQIKGFVKNTNNINICLLRETTHFKEVINDTNTNDDFCLLDINELSKSIIKELTNKENNFVLEQDIEEDIEEDNLNRIKDYILLSFLLGNDFIQGHISLNIRTGGFDKILNAYKEIIINNNKYLIKNNKIIWKNIYELFNFLQKYEEKYIINELNLRKKRYNNQRLYNNETHKKMYEKFESIPNYERDIENYINPFKEGWEYRYYKSLFDIEITNERRKQICINYLEGLEWIFKYYTCECPDYLWKYKYYYSPLLQDIIKFIPILNERDFIKQNNNKIVSSITQLIYVLPKKNIENMYPEIYEKIIKTYPDFYDDNIEFLWAFKKYFWECSPKLPEIDIQILENYVVSQNLK